MGTLLNVGVRALMANQVALQTAGNNIANVNTTGYSRQSVSLETVPGQFSGSGYYGQGVSVATIQRNYDDFLTKQAVVSKSVAASEASRLNNLTQLEGIFPGGSSGMGASVSNLLNAFSDVASAPTDLTARSVVLAKATDLTNQLQNANTRLNELQQGVDASLKSSITAINDLAKQIASANDKIVQALGNGQPPNDLLDKRDQLISNLNQYIQTTSIAASDGSVGVFVAGSQPLVLGNTATSMTLGSSAFSDLDNSQVAIMRNGVSVPIGQSMIGGGELNGLLTFKNSDLADARDQLGRLTLGLCEVMNKQHNLGLNLDGNPGGNFFKPLPIANALPAITPPNASPLTVVGVTVSDPTVMVASRYHINFTGAAAGTVTRLSDGVTTAFAAVPITVDGLTFGVTGIAASAGDSFLVKPYNDAPAKIATAFSSARGLAVASPVEAKAGAANTGGLSLASLVAKTADPNLTQSVTLTFTSAGSFKVVGTGTGNPTGVAYTAGNAISYNGWQLTLKGTPQAGDTFVVQAATPGYAARNAGNAEALMGLRDQAMFDGAALTDGYAGLMADVGTRVSSSKLSTDVTQAMAKNMETNRTSVAGVNLDEEAANLLKYQQAYQASGKMIQIAQSIFDTLIQNLGR
jgi:flagellar hook-associated protein 1 FlgK